MTENQRVKIFAKTESVEDEINMFITNPSIKAVNASIASTEVIILYEEFKWSPKRDLINSKKAIHIHTHKHLEHLIFHDRLSHVTA